MRVSYKVLILTVALVEEEVVPGGLPAGLRSESGLWWCGRVTTVAVPELDTVVATVALPSEGRWKWPPSGEVRFWSRTWTSLSSSSWSETVVPR